MRQIGSGPTRSLLPGAGLSVYADKATVGPIVHTYSSPYTLTETAASYGSLNPIAIPPSAADIASGYIINTSCSEFSLPSASLIATALGFSPHLTPHMYFDVIIDNSRCVQALTITLPSDNSFVNMMGPAIPLGTIQTLRLYFVFAASTVTALAMTVPIDVFTEYVNNPSFYLSIGNLSRAVQLCGQVELVTSSVVSPSSDPTVLTSSPTTYPPSLIIGSPQIITDESYCISPPDYSGSTLFVTRGGSGQNDIDRTIWLPAVITKLGYRIRIVLSSQTVAASAMNVYVKLTSSTITQTGTYSGSTPTLGAANFLGSIASADNSGGTGATGNKTGDTITFGGSTTVSQTTYDGALAGDFIQLECDGYKIMVSGCMRINRKVTLTTLKIPAT
jgi:hypothetical protein